MMRPDGLSEDEGAVMDALIEAVECFDELPVQHPNDTHEFYSAIHHAQDLLALRIARRCYPEGWPTHTAEPEAAPLNREHLKRLVDWADGWRAVRGLH